MRGAIRGGHRAKTYGWTIACAAAVLAPGTALADGDPPPRDPTVFGAVEGGGALLTAAMEGAPESLAAQYGVRAGIRMRRWGVALRIEQTFWRTPERARTFVQSAVNVAIGVEHLFLEGRLRSAMDVGLSILARDNAIDGSGKTGLFFDLRPLGARWRLGEWVTVGIEPLHVALVAPVLTGIPLVDVQFRTTVYLEVGPGPP